MDKSGFAKGPSGISLKSAEIGPLRLPFPDADPFSPRSSMSSSLGGSMGGSCLQQRAEGYPAYVFHEPLHSLTQSYSHAHSTAAHSQPHRGIPTSHGGTPTTPGGQPAGPGGAPYQPTTSTATGEFTLKDCLFVPAESSKPSIGTQSACSPLQYALIKVVGCD